MPRNIYLILRNNESQSKYLLLSSHYQNLSIMDLSKLLFLNNIPILYFFLIQKSLPSMNKFNSKCFPFFILKSKNSNIKYFKFSSIYSKPT